MKRSGIRRISRVEQMLRGMLHNLEAQFGRKRGRRVGIVGTSCLINTAIGLGKLLIGVFSLSFFTCVSAFYSFGMVAARVCILAGLFATEDRREEYRYCWLSGMILSIASLLYVFYTVRLFWLPGREDQYHLYVAIGIAAFTFAELGINIHGVIAERRNNLPMFQTLKTINLASALISLVLTQRALLTVASEAGNFSLANILMGILMGTMAAMLGLSLMLYMNRMETFRNYGKAYRSVRRIARSEGVDIKLKPVYYYPLRFGRSLLGIRILSRVSCAGYEALRGRVRAELQIEMLNAARFPLSEVRKREEAI